MHHVYNGIAVPLYVHNDGNATVNGFRWEAVISGDISNDMGFKQPDGSVPPRTMTFAAS